MFVLAPDTQKFESEPEEPGIAISNVIVPDSQDTEEQVEEKVDVDQVFVTDLDATMLPGDQYCPNCKCILICNDASTQTWLG